jgi:tricorn protease
MTIRFARLLPILCLVVAASARAADVHDTRLLTDPAISGDRIAFAYANDLWVANLDGTNVLRLTSHPGVEASPHFSPDGKLIAFTGRYDGNTDVFVVPTDGGAPKRLTWHPAIDRALGFTPDGKSVLFASSREVYTGRYVQLFTVPIGGGVPTRLPIPHAYRAAISPDGTTIAYQPIAEASNEWKNYRGGQASRIVLFDTKSYATEKIPQPEGRCNDIDPRWNGRLVYFRSDRDGEFNLYSYDLATKQVSRLTQHTDFPVLGLSAANGRILYEQAGYLHLLDLAGGGAKRLKIAVPADLVETRPRFVKAAKFVRGFSLAPSGARAAFEIRGDIVTIPREKGDDRNLTRSPGAHDHSPAWSPDGKQIAYVSDASGENTLRIAAQDGHGEPREIALKGSGFYDDLSWSPDGQKISLVDNSRTLWIVDVASGQNTKVDADPFYGPVRVMHHTWSPDSRWLAYTRNSASYLNTIRLFSLGEGKSWPVTDGLADATFPAFDPNGKYLYFLVSTDAGPVQDWFSQANVDMAASRGIYLAVLAKGVPSPLAKQSDEEGVKKEGDKDDKTARDDGAKPAGTKDPKESKPPVIVTVDQEGLSQRILALPVKSAGYSDLQVGATGQIFYRKEPGAVRNAETSLNRYDLEKRKEDTLADGVTGFEVSPSGKSILVRLKDSWSICDLGEKIDLAKFKLNLDAVQVKIDPIAEWAQIFNEAWRINRDFFYDPGMHGTDWKAMRAKYAAFLPDVATRQDLNRVMQWMFSELAVGHHRVGGGDSLAETESVPGGLLGADYSVENGRYRFKKIFGGLNWTPDLRSPLTEPGVDVKPGEYLLAVDGVPLRPPESLFARFERTAGRIVEITVGPNADGSGSRVVKVVPVETELALRNRDWVEGNLRKVTEATKGRVAYVYVPNTADLGHTYFKRYFFPQADREGIIVDERHNGGGQVADYYIDLLRRPEISHWAMRYGADLKSPIAGIHGPKVMIADETAGSGGDLLPWMFKKLKLGPVIGTRTWGGLVGVLGFPELIDGGFVTAPDIAIWTEDGWVVESEGVPPDIEVEQTPADVIAGHDPQLERAIEVVMKELPANPPKPATHPPYPIRVRKP